MIVEFRIRFNKNYDSPVLIEITHVAFMKVCRFYPVGIKLKIRFMRSRESQAASISRTCSDSCFYGEEFFIEL